MNCFVDDAVFADEMNKIYKRCLIFYSANICKEGSNSSFKKTHWKWRDVRLYDVRLMGQTLTKLVS